MICIVIANWKKGFALRLEKYLYMCLKDSSFKQVAVRENVLWDVLQDLFNCYAQKEIKDNLDYFPTRIGIDEFSYRKGKKDYAVVLVDLDRGLGRLTFSKKTYRRLVKTSRGTQK